MRLTEATGRHREKLWVKKSRNKLDTILVQVFTQVVFLQKKRHFVSSLDCKEACPKAVISGPPKTNKSFDISSSGNRLTSSDYLILCKDNM